MHLTVLSPLMMKAKPSLWSSAPPGGGRHLVDTRPAEWESVITLSLQGNVPVILPYIPDAPGFTLRGATFQTHRTIAVTPVRARGLPVYVMVLFFEGPISTVPEDLTLRLHKGSERMGAILEDLHRPRTLPMPAPEPVPVVNAPMRVKRYVRSRRPKIQGLGAAINRLTLARPSLGSGR